MTSRLTAVFLMVACLCRPVFADGGPAAPVRTLCDSLIEVMKQGSALGFEGRDRKLLPVVTMVYDMGAVTKGTLGLLATKLSPEDLSQLAEAYGRFSAATYADQFTHWQGEKFEIEAPQPQDNGAMLVPSWLVGGDGTRTEINYLVRDSGNGWHIVDVLFSGSISQVAVRRSEFVPIFRANGLAGLIAILDKKSQALQTKGG